MASDDWTTGPAKWVAVIVLGLASVSGLAWSALTRAPRQLAPAAPASPAAPFRPVEAPASPAAVPQVSAPAAFTAAAPTTTAARRINLNTATSAQLQLLPGIGPALAGRILDYRTKNGPFRSVEDLDNVKGIGPRTLEKLRPLVTVE
jgi:comEA protein